MRTTDVLVLGGGIAGVAAALAAAAAGARTVLVRGGPGATAVCGGGWIGTPPDPLRAALAAAGLLLDECTGPLPHPDGRLLRFDLAAPAQQGAAIVAGDAASLVCGIAGLPGFRAAALATLWSEAGGSSTRLEAATIRLPDTPAAGWSAGALAARLEREPDRLGSLVAAAARERGAARIILPAVLGIDGHARVTATIEAAAGVPVGEALGTTPSIPGWRLDRALLRALEAGGVTVVSGFVSEHTARDRTVRLVSVTASRDALTFAPGAVVLATGKFLGGGITAQTRFVESALRTPICVDQLGREGRDAKESLTITSAVRSATQPVLRAGVRTDPDGRPIASSGEVVLRNVVAAGSVRAGTETASLGLGNAARDGWDAGTRAAAIADSDRARD